MADPSVRDDFYELFWRDADYQRTYALDAAVRDRAPTCLELFRSAHHPKPRRVLDFGCGNGALTSVLHSEGFAENILGVDISKKGIAAAKQHEAPGLSFQHLASLRELSGLGPFDLVVASHVLEHVPNVEELLDIFLSLAPMFIIEVPLERNLNFYFRKWFRGIDPRENDVGHVHFWDRKGVRSLLNRKEITVLSEKCYCPMPAVAQRGRKDVFRSGAFKAFGPTLFSRLLTTHYAVLGKRK